MRTWLSRLYRLLLPRSLRERLALRRHQHFCEGLRFTRTPGWVLDGNYNRSRPVKWRNVDLVVWVDYGFARTLRQAICRAISRASSGQELWPGTGNRESFRRAFLSRDSIIWWTLKTWKNNRQRYQSDMSDQAYRHVRFVRLRHPRQTEDFIRQLQRQVAPR